jgi:hypothetical protein
MVAISHIFTIERAARILGCNEDLLWKLSDQLRPEDGVVWILDINDNETLAFTPRGLEVLQEMIDDQINIPD